MKRVLLLVVFVTLGVTAQSNIPVGWDKIMMDDRPAYMNINTGEISRTYPKGVAKAKSTYSDNYANANNGNYSSSVNSHTVKKGETLSIISRKYNMNLRDLYDLNSSIDFDKLAVGQVINTGNASFGNSSDYHVVRTGETLYSISRSSGISVNELKRLNNLESNILKIGQNLRVN